MCHRIQRKLNFKSYNQYSSRQKFLKPSGTMQHICLVFPTCLYVKVVEQVAVLAGYVWSCTYLAI